MVLAIVGEVAIWIAVILFAAIVAGVIMAGVLYAIGLVQQGKVDQRRKLHELETAADQARIQREIMNHQANLRLETLLDGRALPAAKSEEDEEVLVPKRGDISDPRPPHARWKDEFRGERG